MGYELYITRADNWYNNEGRELTEATWEAVVESDPEMRISGFGEATTPSGETIRYVNPLLAEWLGHPEHDVVWFDFRQGNVVVKNPDELTIAKMHEVAQKLKARVQGDEGEFYD